MISEATQIEARALRDLRTHVEGRVHLPATEEFESACAGWNLVIRHQPELIVEAESIADVQAAVDYANALDLPIAVQATGHGQPRCCDRGVLILLGKLNYVVIDEQRGTAHIAGGAQWKDVLGLAQKAGLAALSGSAPHVGVVGYLLGGGFPIMARKYGLAVDTVRSMKVVIADGSLVTASETDNPDLFWALRGGGGAFGIVVEIELALVAQPQVFGGAVLFPAELAPQLYPKWLEWTRGLSPEVTPAIELMFFPPVPFVPEMLQGKSFVMIEACVTAPTGEAEALLAPMRELPGAVLDTFEWMPYAESGRIYNDPADPLPANGAGVLLKDLDADDLARMLKAIGPIDRSPNLKVQLRQLGGAVADSRAPGSAVGSRREAGYLLYLLGIPMPPNSPEAMRDQAEKVFAALGHQVLCRGPLNWLGEGHVPAQAIEGVYDRTDYMKLAAIKREVDPANRFRFAGIGVCA